MRRQVLRQASRSVLLSTSPNPANAYTANAYAANANPSVSVVTAQTHTPVANPADADATVVTTIVARRRVTVAHIAVTTRCDGYAGRIYSLFPSKLWPGGFQGQEEALRPPRRRQLFVFASDHSFTGIEQMPVAQPQNTRGNPERAFRCPANFSAGPCPSPRAGEAK